MEQNSECEIIKIKNQISELKELISLYEEDEAYYDTELVDFELYEDLEILKERLNILEKDKIL